MQINGSDFPRISAATTEPFLLPFKLNRMRFSQLADHLEFLNGCLSSLPSKSIPRDVFFLDCVSSCPADQQSTVFLGRPILPSPKVTNHFEGTFHGQCCLNSYNYFFSIYIFSLAVDVLQAIIYKFQFGKYHSTKRFIQAERHRPPPFLPFRQARCPKTCASISLSLALSSSSP